MTKIASDILDSYEYDAEKQVLFIKFKNQSTYAYSAMPAEKVKAFEDAESKGKFFFKQIKPHHACTKIPS